MVLEFNRFRKGNQAAEIDRDEIGKRVNPMPVIILCFHRLIGNDRLFIRLPRRPWALSVGLH